MVWQKRLFKLVKGIVNEGKLATKVSWVNGSEDDGPKATGRWLFWKRVLVKTLRNRCTLRWTGVKVEEINRRESKGEKRR